MVNHDGLPKIENKCWKSNFSFGKASFLAGAMLEIDLWPVASVLSTSGYFFNPWQHGSKPPIGHTFPPVTMGVLATDWW